MQCRKDEKPSYCRNCIGINFNYHYYYSPYYYYYFLHQEELLLGFINFIILISDLARMVGDEGKKTKNKEKEHDDPRGIHLLL